MQGQKLIFITSQSWGWATGWSVSLPQFTSSSSRLGRPRRGRLPVGWY